MIELPRRQFITGLISLMAAPAIVRAGSLMKVRSLIVPEKQLREFVITRKYSGKYILYPYGDIITSECFNVGDVITIGGVYV